jgi:hypothetical protein
LAASCADPDVLLRFEGAAHPVSLLAEEVGDAELPADPAEREAAVDRALGSVMLRLWAESRPLDAADRDRLAERWRTIRVTACVDANLRRHFNAAGDLVELARTYFEEHREAFDEPERFLLKMIFLPAGDPRTPALAAELLTELRRDPGRFGELARTHSRSRTAARDGETGVLVGTSVHPEVRAAVARRRDSAESFRVDTERGVYLLQVVDWVDGVQADFDSVRMAALRRAREALADELFEEVRAQVEAGHRAVVDEEVFVHPAPDPEAVVYRFDDTGFTVSDLVDDPAALAGVTGPTVQAQFVKHRRWLYFAEHFSCTAEGDPPGDDELARLRLPELLREFASEHLREEAVEWARRQGLSRSRAYTLDLYVLPYRSADPYDDLVGYRPAIDAIRAGGAEPEQLAAAHGLVVAPDLTIDEERLLAFEPNLVGGLRLLAEGACSDYLSSSTLGAFVVVCMERQLGEQGFDPESAEDVDWALQRFLVRRQDEVLDALVGHIAGEFRVNRAAVERFTSTLGRRASNG